MLPSWLSRLKDVKSSYRKLPSGKRCEESPAVLARSLSLQRANARAKSSRSEALAEHQCDAHRLSKSIDALYVLSSMKEGVNPIDSFVSDECEEWDCSVSRADADINKVALSLIQERTDRGLDLWDREFSSMSSYASDHDGVSGRERGIRSASAVLLKPTPAEERFCNEGGLSETEVEDFTLVFDTEASCSESDSADSVVSCKCGCEDEWQRGATTESAGEASTAWKKKKKKTAASRRKGHKSSSISAFLPADLQGIVGDSIALVKISHNPYEDFRESMYQMIMEKDLEESVDMEELLYCYLTLNSPEHHDLIKEVFSDVWSEILMRLR